MGSRRKDLTSRQYQARRAAFLADWNGPCAWCKRRKATQVDHVIEVDRGADPADESNWVGSCAKCNAQRGANYLAAKRDGMNVKRGQVKETPAGFFGTTSNDDPDPFFPYVPNESEHDGSDETQGDAGGSHEIQPRLETPVYGGLSFGPDVAAVAQRELGMKLMPWQLRALSGQLEVDDDGKFRRRRALVSVARQNGKTLAIKSLILWALLEEPKRRGEPILIISTAHQLNLAAEIFESLGPMLEKRHKAKCRWSYGRQEAVMPDGSRWMIQAATPSRFHGYSPHFIIADEVWGISPDVLLNGALPSQRVMRSPLLSCWSTAGTESSRAMIQMREEGLRAIDEGRQTNLYFAEWSVPPGVDAVNRPDLWHLANPALGYTLEREVLDDEVNQVDKAAFMRASLNVWITSNTSWLPPGTFDALVIEDVPAGGVLAVDSSPDESMYCGVRAVPMEDGMIGVTVDFVVDSLAKCWAEINERAKSCTGIALTPSLFELAPDNLHRRKVQVGYSELATHTGTIRQLILEERILHTGEQMLREHVDRAVGVTTQRGYALSSQRSNGPITLARCMVFACALVAKPRSSQRPTIAYSR